MSKTSEWVIPHKTLEEESVNYSEYVANLLKSKDFCMWFKIDLKSRELRVARATLQYVVKNKSMGSMRLKTKLIDGELFGLLIEKD